MADLPQAGSLTLDIRRGTVADEDDVHSGGEPSPPLEFCPIVTLVELFSVGVTLNINQNNLAVTSTDNSDTPPFPGPPGAFAQLTTDAATFLLADNSSGAELTINSASDLTNVVAFLGVNGDGGEGIIVLPGSGVAPDGQILRLSDLAVLDGAAQIPLPTTFNVIANGDTGDITYDNGTLSGLVNNNPPLLASALQFLIGAAPRAILNATVNITLNMGSSSFTHPVPANFFRHCNLPPPPPDYKLFDLFSGGTAELTNDDRTAGWITDAGGFSSMTATINKELVDLPAAIGGATFELSLEAIEPDSCNEWEIGAISFSPISAQNSLEFKINWSTGKYFRVELIAQNTSDPSTSKSTLIIRHAPVSVNDVIASSFVLLGGGNVGLRHVYKLTLETVFFDVIPYATPLVTTFSPFLQTLQSNNIFPPAVEFRTTFNGVEADYKINDYPETFLDSFGDPMPSKIAIETRSARFLRYGLHDFADAVITVPPGGASITATNGVASAQDVGVGCPVFMYSANGVRVVMIEITALPATADEFYLELDCLNKKDAKIRIGKVGADCVLEVNNNNPVATTDTVKSAWTPAVGDFLAIESNTDTGLTKAHLWDGSTVSSSISLSYPNDPYVAYVPITGVLNMPVSESFGLNSGYKAANMQFNIKAVLAALAMDLEGAVI